MSIERRKKEVVMLGTTSSGKTQYLKYLNGEKVHLKGAVLAKCFDCMGFYVDGRHDCKVPECSLYPWMPYKHA